MPDAEQAKRSTGDRLERERLYQEHGPVLAIGGAEDKTQDAEILAKFARISPAGRRLRS